MAYYRFGVFAFSAISGFHTANAFQQPIGMLSFYADINLPPKNAFIRGANFTACCSPSRGAAERRKSQRLRVLGHSPFHARKQMK
jgi:hypothetical protein